MIKIIVQTSLTVCIAGAGAVSVALAEDTAGLIALARSAGPAMISDNAAVMYRGKVIAEGSNGWTCLPETLPDDGAPMCNDAVWMEMMQAMGSGASFTPTSVGFSYMLQGDAGVSNSNPMHPMGKDAPDFIKEGAHLMMIVPRELLQSITNNPHAGGPYVMWGDTPYAHIMVPIDDR
ncbi:hypothetical protein R0135_06235 [Congregibacter variabilis]|uniref:Uncharacterized protein n=1 Tax=Congregibacter variabilis TaxID=3081200 RepID=A0ABZ0I6U1_9GAMM|nr:hypothetical protein R0135_06235 [Congregibacter sp. IMCC43200]